MRVSRRPPSYQRTEYSKKLTAPNIGTQARSLLNPARQHSLNSGVFLLASDPATRNLVIYQMFPTAATVTFAAVEC